MNTDNGVAAEFNSQVIKLLSDIKDNTKKSSENTYEIKNSLDDFFEKQRTSNKQMLQKQNGANDSFISKLISNLNNNNDYEDTEEYQYIAPKTKEGKIREIRAKALKEILEKTSDPLLTPYKNSYLAKVFPNGVYQRTERHDEPFSDDEIFGNLCFKGYKKDLEKTKDSLTLQIKVPLLRFLEPKNTAEYKEWERSNT